MEKVDAKLDFIIKNRGFTYASDEDVSITAGISKTKGRNDRHVVRFTFRNNADKKITHTGYLTVAILGERLYFKEMSEMVGYKLYKNSKKNTYTGICNKGLFNWAVTHSGDYMLKFDRTIALYYVDTE
ncbi:MAG: hypothetical protein IJ736_08480 [Firmicutes bacterium]|nr:hypothetical protein [Bacillota bacterium]